MTHYPSDRLFEEVVYLGYYLHWPHDQIITMNHHERQRWVREVARLNARLNEQMLRSR